ncbi:MAG: protein kinase [Nannocystaceae bacterium]|nr:protein kinase [Nannocystaceae bacterium]
MHDEPPTTGSPSSEHDSWLRSLGDALRGTSRAQSWIAAGVVVDGSYRVAQAIGAGGMAVVYLAHDLALDRRVALKVYDVDARELSPSRIRREARAMARTSHPNVLVVHDVGVHEGRTYLAMEYVEGGTLRAWLAEQPRSLRDIVAMFVQCARGLAAAHEVGLVHGDFKPDNVLVGADARARVADFGLARNADRAPERDPSLDDEHAARRFVGTPRYAAPEQGAGEPIDARADQFSLCVALYEAVHGVHPFVGETALATATAIATDQRRKAPATRAVPRWLDRVLARGLAHRRDDRFPRLDDLVAALERGSGSRRALVAIGATIATATVLAAWSRGPACAEAGAAIDAHWNDARAAALTDAFQATRSPIADEASAASRERLQAWSAAWRELRRESCLVAEDAADHQLLDRRIACLDGQLSQLDAAVETLAAADRDAVASAIDVVAGLPAPSRCADDERLRAAVAPPEDPALARDVDAARHELGLAHAVLTLGRYPEVARRAAAVAAGDAARRHRPLVAEAALLRGMAHWRAFEYAAAEQALTSAYEIATEVGDDALATVAARELVCAVGQTAGADERAQWWSNAAASAQTRVAAPIGEQLELAHCRALALHSAGRFRDAEQLLREALGAVDSLAAADDELLPAQLHDRLGAVLDRLSRREEALREHEAAYASALATRGANHPVTVVSRSNAGQSLSALGRHGDALAIGLDSLQRLITVFGPDSGRLVNEYNNIAARLRALGAAPQAIAYREQGIAIARARGDQGRTLALLLGNLANDHYARGDIHRAIAIESEAIDVSVAALGADHPDTAAALQNHATTLAVAGRRDEAQATFERARELLEARYGDEHPALGVLYMNLVGIARETGEDDRAQHYLASADRVAEANNDDRLRAMILIDRGAAAHGHGELAAAADFHRRAAALAHGLDASLERMAAFQLGADEEARGELPAALAAYAQSRALAVAAEATVRVAACELAMARVRWALGERTAARELAASSLAAATAAEDRDAIAEASSWLAAHRSR